MLFLMYVLFIGIKNPPALAQADGFSGLMDGPLEHTPLDGAAKGFNSLTIPR